MSLDILVVEDEELAAKHLRRALERQGYDVRVASSANEAFRAAAQREPQIVLLDLNLPDRFGVDVLKDLRRQYPACEVVVNTGVSDLSTAVQAMRAGAYDYILKPLNLDTILLTIQRVADARALKEENRFLREQYVSQFSLDHVGIHSSVLATVFEEASRFAHRELPVLIQGESGTGKELVARHIHARSAPQGKTPGPFIPINCGALPLSLAESELFGYVGGAFTGAERGGRSGKFAAANGGTVFLDEVGELPLEIQAKLLRFLQERCFYQVGGTKEVSVDVKVICATNRHLPDEVAAGRFRKDLFFRINVGCLFVPPLRQRPDEIGPLARQFLAEFAHSYKRQPLTVAPDAMTMLLRHPWPGNVRELRNLCERVVLVVDPPQLTADALQRLGLVTLEDHVSSEACRRSDFQADFCVRPEYLPAEGFDLEEHLNAVVLSAFEKNGENQSRTARYLNITREVLRHRLKKLGLIGV